MTRHIKILDRQFVPAGTLVLEQGTPGNRAYVVESGKIVVFIKDDNGNEVILTELGPGSLVGEMAAISDGQRCASARTWEDSVLITISAHDLHSSMRASEALQKRLMRMMVDRMRDTNIKLLEKERQLADVEQAAWMNIDAVTTHLNARRARIQTEIVPILDDIKSALGKNLTDKE